MNKSISEELERVCISNLRKHLYIFDEEEIEFILSKVIPEIRLALTAERKELRERVGKKRHYDLEEFDHESKLMSVGFNQAIDQVLSLLEGK